MTDFGLQLFNSAGQLILDTSSRVARFVASGTTGSIPVDSYVDIYITGIQNNDSWNVVIDVPLGSGGSVTVYSGYFRLSNLASAGATQAATFNYWVVRS